MRPLRRLWWTLLALCCAAGVAHADPPQRARRGRTPTPPPPATCSVAWPNHGTLENGRRLASTDVRTLPGRTLQWGTDELVGLLERTAAKVRQQFHVPLTVGDLSARCGGAVSRHRSHQSGRDADLAFFARTESGRPATLQDYVVFDRDGRSRDGSLRFDVARNWALVEALLTDRQVRVERLFVSTPLRALLLQHARSVHAAPQLVALAANTLVQPARVSPHDNHFHVRIGCPAGDRQCHTGVWQPPRPRRRRPMRVAAHAHPAHPAPPARSAASRRATGR